MVIVGVLIRRLLVIVGGCGSFGMVFLFMVMLVLFSVLLVFLFV